MDRLTTTFKPDTRVLNLHRQWLDAFDSRHAKAWEDLLNSEPEGAMCEAMYCALLRDYGVCVEPNADLDGGKRAPDFLCRKDDRKFYVEVTCIRIDTATKHSLLPEVPANEARHYHPLNDAIHAEVVNKTRQCANLDAPCLLAIGTFHYGASVSCIRKTFMEWLLIGKSSIGWYLDPRRGVCVGDPFQVTNAEKASFFKPGFEPARKPISALIVAGFGDPEGLVYGVIHPYAVREFDPTLLDQILFCRLKRDMHIGSIATEWTRDPNVEMWRKYRRDGVANTTRRRRDDTA